LLFLAYEGIEKTVPEDTTSPICLGFNSWMYTTQFPRVFMLLLVMHCSYSLSSV
jgi:hypothetical protein